MIKDYKYPVIRGVKNKHTVDQISRHYIDSVLRYIDYMRGAKIFFSALPDHFNEGHFYDACDTLARAELIEVYDRGTSSFNKYIRARTI